MNVASLENCKRLYELSGWADTFFHHFDGTRMIDSKLGAVTVYEKMVGVYENTVGCDECEGEHTYRLKHLPAYDAGYLLRKLPAIILDKGVWQLALLKDWVAQYQSADVQTGKYKTKNVCIADTPEDALCLLAIKLFEAGVLTREGVEQ